MDVRCEKCQTEYVLDDERVGESGVTVRCTACDNIFKVGGGEKSGPVAGEPAASSSEEGTDSRPWLLRKHSGEVFKFDGLATLHKWIVERRAFRTDEISRSGQSWKQLGDIAELATFFHVVEQADQAAQEGSSQDSTPTPSRREEPPAAPAPSSTPPRAEPPAEQVPQQPAPPQAAPPAAPAPSVPPQTPPVPLTAQGSPPASPPAPSDVPPKAAPTSPPPSSPSPAPAAGMGQVPAQGSEPAWTGTQAPNVDDGIGDIDDEDFEDFRRGGAGKWVLLLFVLLVGGAGTFYFLDPDRALDLIGLGERVPEQAIEGTQEGWRALALGTSAAHDAAEEAFFEALELAGDAPLVSASGGLAEVAAERVVALAADLEELQGEAEEAVRAAEADDSELSEEGRQKVARVEELQQKAVELTTKAHERAETAYDLDPESLFAMRATAAYYAVTGEQEGLEGLVQRATATPDGASDGRLAYWRGVAARDQGDLDSAAEHFRAALEADDSLANARFGLAMVHAASEEHEEALVEAQRTLEASPEHEGARALAEEMEPLVAEAREERALAEEAEELAAAEEDSPADEPDDEPPEVEEPPAEPAKAKAPSQPRRPTFRGVMNQALRARNRGNLEQALDLYTRASQMRPNDPEAYAGQGYCYIEMRAWHAAVAAFEQALERQPNHGRSMIGLAEAHKLNGDESEARRHYERYLELYPSGPEAAVAETNLERM